MSTLPHDFLIRAMGVNKRETKEKICCCINDISLNLPLSFPSIDFGLRQKMQQYTKVELVVVVNFLHTKTNELFALFLL